MRTKSTNTYSPQMNGIAERINRTLLNTARDFMEEAKLPSYLWAELVSTAAYLKNRLKHSQIDNKVPLEVWNGNKPRAPHLHHIG